MTTQLVCLPFAGAHMDPFHGLRTTCEAQVEGLRSTSVTYPGHGRRISESVATSVDALAADALVQVRDHARAVGASRTVLVGYSLGALVAYELARLLTAAGDPPAGLHLMASTPPAHVNGTDLLIDDDDDLLEHCEQYGILQANSFPDAALRRLFLPALRSDILAVDRYAGRDRPRRVLAPGMPVTVYTGDDDLTVTDMDAWADVTDGPVTTRRYPGGHFFLTECREALWRDVVAALAPFATDLAGDLATDLATDLVGAGRRAA